MKTPRLLIAALAITVVSVACSSAGSSTSIGPTTPPPPTSTTAVPTTTVPATATTTTVAPTTTVASTTTAAGACSPSAAPIPSDAAGISTATGDFDGDGLEDELTVYGEGAPDPWHIRVTLNDGYTVDFTLPGGEMIARAVGGHDVDLDGDDEIFAVVGSGASAFIVGIYTVLDCDVSPLAIDGVAAAQFAVGASAANQSGLQCLDGGGVAVYSQSTSDGVTYDQQIDEYGVEDGVMTLEGSVALVLTSPLDDGQIFIAAEFACGALSLV